MRWRSTSSTQICSSCLSPTFTCMFPKYTAGHWRDGSLLGRGQSPGETDGQGRRSAGFVFLYRCFTTWQRGSCQTLLLVTGWWSFAKMRTAVLLFAVGLCVLNVTAALKICAFNVQSFGESKANNKKVMGILLKVLFCLWTQQVEQRPHDTTRILFLVSPPRFSLGATCVWFRRSVTLKGKQYELWWRIWTGEGSHGFQFWRIWQISSGIKQHLNFYPLSADMTNPTRTPTWRVKGSEGKPTRSNTSTFTGGLNQMWALCC